MRIVPRFNPWPEPVVSRVKALLAAGRTDRQIAEAMADVFPPGRAGHNVVRNLRVKRGWPRNVERPQWSAETVELVRLLNSQGMTDKQIAEAMADVFPPGRKGAMSVRKVRYRHRMPSNESRRWPVEVLARVRELHAEGLTDREIALAMPDKFARGRQVLSVRRNHGLPLNPDGEGRRLLGKRLGAKGKAKAHAAFARRNGWPDDLPPRGVQILNVLATAGPRTVRQLAGDIDTTVKNAARYAFRLRGRGMVAALRAGRSIVYTLTTHAVRTRKEMLHERQQAEADDAGRDARPHARAGRRR